MIMNTEEVPEDGLIAVLVTCKVCNGSTLLPSGQICQTCKDGKLTQYVSVNALVKHSFKQFQGAFKEVFEAWQQARTSK